MNPVLIFYVLFLFLLEIITPDPFCIPVDSYDFTDPVPKSFIQVYLSQ